MNVDITGYDDKTLDKVRAGIREADPFLDERGLLDMVDGMQNQGILFRERAEGVERKLIGPAHAHADAPCSDDCYLIVGKPTRLSDGFHTMEELYDHRRALTAVLAGYAAKLKSSWRSKAHHPANDPMFEGYFIVGIELDTGAVTYHYKLTHWDDFAAVPELEHAPKWDGATPVDSVTRLMALAHRMASTRWQ